MRVRFCLRSALIAFSLLGLVAEPALAQAQDVELKALGRFDGWRENALIGHGIVIGLAGSGDSSRNAVTRQALSNVYNRLGITVDQADLSARNVAAVIAVASLPASANVGDRISVTVSSAGDARSLAGGTLLMTPLLGPDGRPYALAQGSLVTGGYSFESNLNVQQRNYPTTARLEDGASVETAVDAHLLDENGDLRFLLREPNFTTATRVAAALDRMFGFDIATAVQADEVRIHYRGGRDELTAFISAVQNVRVAPDRVPRIVINERTGTVVAGADVTISSVVIAQGDIRVTVTAESYASQPSFISGFANDIASLVVTNTQLEVNQGSGDVIASFPNSTVADLIQGLSEAQVGTREMITILQGIKNAGALHAEIIVQ